MINKNIIFTSNNEKIPSKYIFNEINNYEINNVINSL